MRLLQYYLILVALAELPVMLSIWFRGSRATLAFINTVAPGNNRLPQCFDHLLMAFIFVLALLRASLALDFRNRSLFRVVAAVHAVEVAVFVFPVFFSLDSDTHLGEGFFEAQSLKDHAVLLPIVLQAVWLLCAYSSCAQEKQKPL